jgi:hypothetical protein
VATCATLDAEALYSARSPGEYEQVRADRRETHEYLQSTKATGSVHSTRSASWLGLGGIERSASRT